MRSPFDQSNLNDHNTGLGLCRDAKGYFDFVLIFLKRRSILMKQKSLYLNPLDVNHEEINLPMMSVETGPGPLSMYIWSTF